MNYQNGTGMQVSYLIQMKVGIVFEVTPTKVKVTTDHNSNGFQTITLTRNLRCWSKLIMKMEVWIVFIGP